ncbi:hypothetical protein MNBD_GAMMA05-860 [hydrothermal vent metagenome]|uniref:Uncharacterized protein n=1 Tax=hydrothermal vent metagenome TaxID=652676 RepID=A0A3B0W638_9ZZZZ
MSEFTFAISFKCDDLENQDELVEAFDSITSKSASENNRIDLDAIKAKIFFIEKIAKIMRCDLDDELKEFVIDKRFHPVKITNEYGLCVLYFNASSTAGFGGWPDYKHYLAMEKLFEFLGASKVEFKLLKNVEAANDSDKASNDDAPEKIKPAIVKKIKVETKTSPPVARDNLIVLDSGKTQPGYVSEVFYLQLPNGVSTQVLLTVKAGRISDFLTIKFDDYQILEMRLGFFTVFKAKEKSINYKNYKLTFKCRLYLESKVTTAAYSGHLGEFYLDGKKTLAVEF